MELGSPRELKWAQRSEKAHLAEEQQRHVLGCAVGIPVVTAVGAPQKTNISKIGKEHLTHAVPLAPPPTDALAANQAESSSSKDTRKLPSTFRANEIEDWEQFDSEVCTSTPSYNTADWSSHECSLYEDVHKDVEVSREIGLENIGHELHAEESRDEKPSQVPFADDDKEYWWSFAGQQAAISETRGVELSGGEVWEVKRKGRLSRCVRWVKSRSGKLKAMLVPRTFKSIAKGQQPDTSQKSQGVWKK